MKHLRQIQKNILVFIGKHLVPKKVTWIRIFLHTSFSCLFTFFDTNFLGGQAFLGFILPVNGKQWMTCQIYLMLEEDHGTFMEQVRRKI